MDLDECMDLDEWTKWVTLLGAIIAAISGVWSLGLLIRGKRDTFHLGMGTVMPEAIQETCLHVVSRCDHPIKLADYGFIDATGELQSIVMAADLDPLFALQLMQRGSSTLSQRGAQYEAGYTSRESFIGCFARTTLQSRPRLAFEYRTNRLTRLRIRLTVVFKGSAYLA